MTRHHDSLAALQGEPRGGGGDSRPSLPRRSRALADTPLFAAVHTLPRRALHAGPHLALQREVAGRSTVLRLAARACAERRRPAVRHERRD